MTKLLDTNVCIAVIRGHDRMVDRMAMEMQRGAMVVSSITVFELAYGVSRSVRPTEERIKITRFIDLGPTVADFTAADANAAGDIRGDLAARGLLIGNYDLLIAGQAMWRGWTVVTANTREFSRVAGLNVEDWTAAAVP